MEVPHTTGVPAALIRLAQGTLVTEERASLVFLQAVHSFVASGRAVLHNLEGGTPDVTPSQVLIGGVDCTGTYLYSAKPSSTMGEQGISCIISPRTQTG